MNEVLRNINMYLFFRKIYRKMQRLMFRSVLNEVLLYFIFDQYLKKLRFEK